MKELKILRNLRSNTRFFIGNASTKSQFCLTFSCIQVQMLLRCCLTHFQPMFYFYNPWKYKKNLRFSDVFRGYRSGKLVKNGLIHVSMIIVRHFLYLLYFYPCLNLGLFMLYVCDLFFIFILIFIMINRTISCIQTYLFLCLLLWYALSFLDENVDEECG